MSDPPQVNVIILLLLTADLGNRLCFGIGNTALLCDASVSRHAAFAVHRRQSAAARGSNQVRNV